MSELRVGATVAGRRHSLGHLHQVVLDAALNRVVHLVVVSGFGQQQRAVPSSEISSARWDRIELVLDDLDGCPQVDFGRHEHVIGPGFEPDLARLAPNRDLPLIVAGSGFPVVDLERKSLGHVDEWWSDDGDPAAVTHAVVERGGGVRLDHWVVVPSAHFYVDPAPELRVTLTHVDLDALPHHPVLPGTHLDSERAIDLSMWTPRDPDEAAFGSTDPNRRG